MKTILLLSALLLLSLLPRLALGIKDGLDRPLSSDEAGYYHPAESILHGKGYCVKQQSVEGIVARPTAYHMPVPSLILAGVFKCSGGASIRTARLSSILAACLAAPFMLLFARRFIPLPAALLAAVACALYPTWVYAGDAILPEAYFIPVMLLALLLSLRASTTKSEGPAALAGLAWAVAANILPYALPMALLVAVILAFHGRRRAFILALIPVLGLAPWAIRNHTVLDSPIVFTTAEGETLLGANNPYVLADPALHGLWQRPLKHYGEQLGTIHDEVQLDQTQHDLAVQFLQDNHAQILPLAGYKLRRWLTPITATGGSVRVLVLCSYGLLLALLAAAAVLRLFKPTAALAFVVGCSAVLTGSTIVYWGELTRGRMPLEILWLPWGAYAVWEIVCRLIGQPRPQPAPAAAAPAKAP